MPASVSAAGRVKSASQDRREQVARLILMACAIVSFVIAFLLGQSLGIDRSDPTNRARFHAIPIAISQIYHGRPHDYTGYNSVAMPFQGGKPIGELIAQATSLSIPADAAVYFWTADDRGFSDFVNGAFRLFGARIKSLYYFWFLLLGVSLAAALVSFRDDTTALAAIACTMVSIVAMLPLYVRAPGLHFAELSVHISETRMFEILGAVAVVHILLTALRPKVKPTWLELGCFVLQAGLLAFLLHNRSSIAWLFVTLIIFALAISGFQIVRRRDRALAKPAAGIAAILLAAWIAVIGFQTLTFNRAYRGEIGARTVWHNALMGLWFNAKFAQVLKLSNVDDGLAVDAVLRDMTARSDPRLTPEWNRQHILNSLGSHNRFDWRAYENAARTLVMRTLAENPAETLRMIVWDKPLATAQVVSCNAMLMTAMCDPAIFKDKAPARREIRFQPFSWLQSLLLLVVASGLSLAATARPGSDNVLHQLKPVALGAILIAVIGLLPSLIFYPGITQLAGTFLFATLALYLVIVFAVAKLATLLLSRSRAGPPA